MENFLFYAFVKIIWNSSHKHALRKRGDFDAGIKLSNCVDWGWFVISIDG
jgi:hypothetical protein